MKTKNFKKPIALFLAVMLCASLLFSLGTTAFAAEETANVCLIAFPRDGDVNYSGEWGEVILDTGTTGRGNLLMLGESYDNAILKLMASHFDRVYSVDLRSYEQDMGKPFRLAEYLREHRITKVLLIGSTPFFTSDDFMVED